MSITTSDFVSDQSGFRSGVWASRGLALLRIVAALLFMEHGTQKLFGFPAPPSFGMPAPFSLLWFAAVLEVGGGLLVLLGLFTRPVAFILSGQMAVAYWMAHAPRGFFPVLNGGEGSILYCFIFLALAAVGGGAWSVEGVLGKRSG